MRGPGVTRVMLGAILAVCLLACVQTWRLHHAKLAVVELEVQMQAERTRAAESARQAEANYRAIESAWVRRHQEIAHEAEQNARRVATAAAAGAVAGDGLRHRATQLAARCPAPESAAPADPGPTAANPGAVLADVLGRLEAAGRELAAVADARGVAGQACERAYGALRP